MVYTGLNKTSFTIPVFDESLYNIYDLVKTPEEIGFTISETPDLFQINMGRDLMPMDTSNNCAIGQWSIIGKNDNEVAFKFPKMSNGLLDISNRSIGACGWSYSGINLIKVVDKNDVPDNDLLINYLTYDRLTVSLWPRY